VELTVLADSAVNVGAGAVVLAALVAEVVLEAMACGVSAAAKPAIAASMLLFAAALAELAAAACKGSMTVVAVTVGRAGSVEPDGSTVTSLTLLMVSCGGGIWDRIMVEVATPGVCVAELLGFVLDGGVPMPSSMPNKFEAASAVEGTLVDDGTAMLENKPFPSTVTVVVCVMIA